MPVSDADIRFFLQFEMGCIRLQMALWVSRMTQKSSKRSATFLTQNGKEVPDDEAGEIKDVALDCTTGYCFQKTAIRADEAESLVE